MFEIGARNVDERVLPSTHMFLNPRPHTGLGFRVWAQKDKVSGNVITPLPPTPHTPPTQKALKNTADAGRTTGTVTKNLGFSKPTL